MSACISTHGEYSEHELDDRFHCTLCHVVDVERLLAALDEARAEVKAAESALAAVRALVGSGGPRSATAGSPYSTGRWDAFAEVRAALDGETEDGVFGDPDIHARLTRAALATPTTPSPSDGDDVTTEGGPR